MTANGVLMADPVEGQFLSNGLSWGDGITNDDMRVQQAVYDKCMQFMPATWPVKLKPEEVAGTRVYARCMRKHGIPEAVPDQNGVSNESTDGRLYRMPGFDAAVRACQYLTDDPANDLPENK
jgi:hypothetical protein